jgi:hypothetical protein
MDAEKNKSILERSIESGMSKELVKKKEDKKVSFTNGKLIIITC